MSTPIHQQITFNATPERIYDALMNASEHSAFTGGPAEISRDVGGSFSCHGGQIVGRNIELVENRRIVQAWRVANWDEGIYSIVRVELAGDGDATELTLHHDAFPDGMGEHLAGGWHARYWEPLKKHLG